MAGSALLLASLYFSRVVHANYLILAATLLPAAALAARRVPGDLAVVPLLLLALAVEVVENGLFRATWEQAVAAGLPGRLDGVAAALAPRAGPDLTTDPLGLGLGALAAGLGILYLLAAIFGAAPRLRVAAVLLSAALVVVLPTLVVVGIGEATGAVPQPGPLGGAARPGHAPARRRRRAPGGRGLEQQLPARPARARSRWCRPCLRGPRPPRGRFGGWAGTRDG